jgi:hypothetical protein
MTVTRIVLARLRRTGRDLLGLVTLRRHEKRWQTYALRLFVVAMIVVVIPVKKLLQLGVVDAILALLKAGVAVGLVAAGLGAIYAVQELHRRRRQAGRARADA